MIKKIMYRDPITGHRDMLDATVLIALITIAPIIGVVGFWLTT